MSTPVALVTGGNRGIGQAITLALARSGATVVATARDVATVDDTLKAVHDAGGAAVALGCDVREPGSMVELAAAVDEIGPVSTVVANAGTAGPTAPLHEIDPDDWRDCLVTDVDGVFHTFRAFIPGMIERGSGSLIAISSMTGKRPLHGRTPYAAAKMAVIGLVRSLALELGPHGIRANAVCPGAVAGPRIEDVIRRQAESRGIGLDEARAGFTAASPLGKLVEADEVGAVCAFLASDAATAITGEDLNVSAGAVMY
ncbi:SDR family oxidoreductase [Actinomycetospora endophytica]|uniref:SDR family oxidoreductase n=1 Tax=Actinomycetospora endophytica TaxID=2291215 RepID=A0ABS8P475_9PSEU|nr:SDR family NAD(P)-dependent oxidoreductase [Actinomycetospora endophytica]MCD2191859.1 SDR family oxidoreductase [Actinomycetospora endophytica]